MRIFSTAHLSRFFAGRPPVQPPAFGPCTFASLTLPVGALPILSSRELLRSRRESIARIEELAGTTRAHFERYYLGDLARFAAWAQQLPASEAHHHAYPGGLLDRGCEVAGAALSLRRGCLLPPGAPPEEAVLKRDLWTYAVFTLALLHDAAKPAVDQIVTVHGTGRTTWTWDPWAGTLGDIPEARGYTVGFRRQRDYRVHQHAYLLLASRLLSPEGLAWLASDPEVFAAWLAYAGGDLARAGAFADLLARADSESVARSLGAQAPSAAPAAPRPVVPLHDKLITALRHLIDAGDLPLNRRGAAGFRIGDDLWLLSKRVPDALRAHLLAQGHSGIPGDNTRLFDLLQDHGLLVPNSENKAVWRMTVQVEGHADPLSLLRMPVFRIWADPDALPPEFSGAVAPDCPPPGRGETPIPGRTAPPESPSSSPDEAEPPEPTPAVAASGEPLPPPPRRAATPAPSLETPPSLGRQFLDWLIAALRERRLDYNGPKARVHVVPEGVLLTSPGIFKD